MKFQPDSNSLPGSAAHTKAGFRALALRALMTVVVSTVFCVVGPVVQASAEDKTPTDFIDLDVPYVPTPQIVVDKMLELATVQKEDVVYDLGCGDGRIVVTAAKKYGARGVGVDLDPQRVKESRANVKANSVERLVEIREGDALKTDVSRASVVTLYLLPEVNLKLRPQLQKLKPGTRIVSHDFDMGDWKPQKKVEVQDPDGRIHSVFLWVVGK